MKVVILAGGLGTRLSEETTLKPKPMVELGDEPILWHIMKAYYSYGFYEFIICAGYKQSIIKDYFASYVNNHSSIEVSIKENRVKIIDPPLEDWIVKVVDTGLNTMTGGRIKRIERFVNYGDSFFLTYGDGLSNIDLKDLLSFHNKHRPIITVTAVQPPGRFGALKLGGNGVVSEFLEKPKGDNNWVNAGYYVVDRSIFDFIAGDDTIFEREPLETIARNRAMRAYLHHGFWRSMDTMTDKRQLEELWKTERAPWKIWR